MKGFPSKALRGAKQMLSCLFLPPCCSGLDVVSLSLDLSEFQREEEGIQEEANESSHFAVGSRQTLSYLMYPDDNEDDVSLTRLRQTLHCLMQLEDTKDTQQLEDTKDTHSPPFPEVQFSGSKVRETNNHHLNFLVASDGDNASLVTPTARIYKELSMKCHAYGVQEGHGTSVHRILNDAQPPVVDLSAEFAVVLTLPGRDLETAFHFHPFHLTILVRMNLIWINEPPFITPLSQSCRSPYANRKGTSRAISGCPTFILHQLYGYFIPCIWSMGASIISKLIWKSLWFYHSTTVPKNEW